LNNKNFLKSLPGYDTQLRRVSIVTDNLVVIMFRSQKETVMCLITADAEHGASTELVVILCSGFPVVAQSFTPVPVNRFSQTVPSVSGTQ
jgi:hypothetical protein